MNTYQLQQCLLENIFCIPSTRLPTQSRSLEIPALRRSASITHWWDCYSSTQLGPSHTHTLCFLQSGLQITFQATCFLHYLENKSLGASGFNLLPMEGMARAPPGSVQWWCRSAPFLESWRQSCRQKCLPSPAQHTQQQKHPLSLTGFTSFPHHVSQMYSQGKKKHKLLALDTVHSMAEQFRDTLKKNK